MTNGPDSCGNPTVGRCDKLVDIPSIVLHSILQLTASCGVDGIGVEAGVDVGVSEETPGVGCCELLNCSFAIEAALSDLFCIKFIPLLPECERS